MPTVVTSATPYCTAEFLLGLVAWQDVADWSNDTNGPRPTWAALLDPTDRAGAMVAQALATASGDVERAALKGKRYTPTELQALTGNALATLQGLVGWMAVGKLASRRNPARPKEMTDVATAWELLDQIRDGETVFGLENQINAAIGPTVTDFAADADPQRTVVKARPFFGNRSRR